MIASMDRSVSLKNVGGSKRILRLERERPIMNCIDYFIGRLNND